MPFLLQYELTDCSGNLSRLVHVKVMVAFHRQVPAVADGSGAAFDFLFAANGR